MKRIGLILVALLLVASTAMAWDDMRKPIYLGLIDSNDIVCLEVDSAEFWDQEEWIDTTYFPGDYGTGFGWPEQILVRYGVNFIDTSADYSAVDADTLGDDLVDAIALDSAHIGLGIQVSMEGEYWTTIWMDSTLRAATDFRTTYSYLIDVDDLLVRDTLFGGIIRAFSYIYRSVDSVNSWHPVSDSVWLDKLEVWGFGYETNPIVEDYYLVELAPPGLTLTMTDTLQPSANQHSADTGDAVFLKFVPQLVRFEYGLQYMTASCSTGIYDDSGAPFWTIETRDDATQDWRPWAIDSMHNVRDSLSNFSNDFADQDDTVWGRWIRAIENYEMDSDSVSDPSEYDTVIFNGVKLHYYRNIY